jgi:hypothetical protein
MFMGASCQKDEIELADENIEISTFPGITIYKTKNDYINFVDVQITDDGRLNAIPSYNKNDPRISIDEKGNVKQNFRWRLKSGLILDNNVSIREVFTNITIQEYVDWNTENGVSGWPNNLIEPRIIDEDPFTDFYFLDGMNKIPKTYTLGEINKMIEDGTLETVFTKLK